MVNTAIGLIIVEKCTELLLITMMAIDNVKWKQKAIKR